MALPDLSHEWPATKQALHQPAQILGAIRAAVAPPQINYLHLGLRVLPGRLTTGPLAALGEWQLDLRTQTLRWFPLSGRTMALSTQNTTQRALTETVVKVLAHTGHNVTLDRARLGGDTPLKPNPTTAAAYGDALTAVFTLYERLRAALPGVKTPLVVWPHGFDLSFLWFPRQIESEESAHLSFGFSPGSAGLDRPYFYAYAHPIPAGLTATPLPEPARWHKAAWTGMVLPYDEVAPREDAQAAIMDILRAVFEQMASQLRVG
ncbi:MAG: hypothetical protein GX613_11715 [Chloroflexi bacterium]|nr:hypothetical protein [Chloroflexota bacterium]